MTSTTPLPTPLPRLLDPRYRWTTIGSNALIFLGAFEALAVTTIMPTVSRDLHGEALYSVAFSGTLAASIIGMVVAGGWADRRGPKRALITSIGVFLIGLIVSGTAGTMPLFIVGRFLQGLGSGAIVVAIYVVVARLYPPELHPRIFGAFAAAWVLPSMIGPPLAGIVADALSWHWVFLGVGGLVLIATGFIVPSLRQLETDPRRADAASSGRTIAWSIVAAAGILAISLGGDSRGALALPIVAVSFAIVVVALRPLLPRGTLLVRRGLPATVLLRGAVAAAFYSTEIYLPYLLHTDYGFPSWLAGLILTVAAISWAAGSWLQGRLGDRMSDDLALRLGAALVVGGIATQFVTALLLWSPFVMASGWFVAGAGMGLIFPRIGTVVLAFSTDRDQGFNSAAMSIADAAGGATAIAFSGILFVAFGAATGAHSFAITLAFTAVLAVLAVPVALRARAAAAG